MSETKQDVMLGFHIPKNNGKTTKHHGNMTKTSTSGSTPGRFSIFARFETIVGAKIQRIAFRFDEGEVLMVFNVDTDKGIPFYKINEKYVTLNNQDLAKNIVDTLNIKFEYNKGFYFDIEKNAKIGSMQFWKMIPVKRVPETVPRGKQKEKTEIDMSSNDPLDKVIKEGEQYYTQES